jgi:transcriptional regulator with XRE-family HTH domain
MILRLPRDRSLTALWPIGESVIPISMLQRKLGIRIADLRKARQLTQVQLAKAVGCSVEFISLVERGVNAPSVAGLAKFARVLKVEVADLFTFAARKGPVKSRKAA